MVDEPLTIRAALAYGQGQLKASDSPALDARLLLEHVLQADHAVLIAHDNRSLTAEQEAAYRRLVRRAALREPIPYLTGWAPFYGRQFMVTPAVLIPRPDTELLVEQALRWVDHWPGSITSDRSEGAHVVDVGTGSGCIAITLALETPAAKIEAVDVSALALNVARKNAGRLGAGERIVFHEGSLLEPVVDRPDLIVANPPYITNPEWTALDDGIKWYEPDVALRGGQDGFEVIRQLLGAAANQLTPGGAILCEIGWQQGPVARDLARSFFPRAEVEILVDTGGRDRLLAIQTDR